MAKLTDDSIKWMTDLIEGASRTKKFCSSGSIPPMDPGLSVHGVGPVKLPLSPKQAKELIEVGRVAPFGKGTKTLVDTKVRKTFELDASQIELSDSWNAMIAGLATKVRADLGLESERLGSL